MISRWIRGAIKLRENTKAEIESATVELLNKMLSKNEIKIDDIAFAIFTLTPDLNADFPAKYARIHCGFELVPMMCYNELPVEGAISKCLRILLNVNTDKNQNEIKHIYLKGAAALRGDLKNE